MNNLRTIGLLAALFLIGGGTWIAYEQAEPKQSVASIREFAQCLSDAGAVMYGADWCPHCQNQKAMFGEAFELITYVECPKEPQKCLERGIVGYPTWLFANGAKLEGEQSIGSLSAASGCVVPASAGN